MTHPPGAVIVPCTDLGRYTRFNFDLQRLITRLPAGSRWCYARGFSVLENLNDALERLRDEEEWVWLIGDDHAFEPDIVDRLLDLDRDVAVPLCTGRTPPFPLVAFDRELPGPDERWPLYGAMTLNRLDLDETPFKLVAAGSAGMLIRRRVLDAIDPPWFSNSHVTATNEDLEFCRKVTAAGFEIWCDPSTKMGHIGNVIFRPEIHDGQWGLILDFENDHRLFLPGGVAADVFGQMEMVGDRARTDPNQFADLQEVVA